MRIELIDSRCSDYPQTRRITALSRTSYTTKNLEKMKGFDVALLPLSRFHISSMNRVILAIIIVILSGCVPNKVPNIEKTEEVKNLKTEVIGIGIDGDVPLILKNNGQVVKGIAKKELLQLESPVLVGGFSRDGKFVGGVTSKNIFVRALNEELQFLVVAPKTRVNQVTFDSDNKSLFLAGVDGKVYRWNFLEESTIKKPNFERYAGHGSVVSSIVCDVASPVFFSSDWSGVLSAWLPYDADRFSGAFDTNLFGSTIFQDSDKLRTNADRSSDASPIDFLTAIDGMIFGSTQSGVIEQWQIRGFKMKTSIQAHLSSLVAFSSNRSGILVSVGRDGAVKIWNGSTPGEIKLIKEENIDGAKFAAIGERKVVVYLKDGSLREISI